MLSNEQFFEEFPPSLQAAEDTIGRCLRHVQRSYSGVSNLSLFAFELVLREALTNSVEHGAAGGKPVSVGINCNETTTTIEVRDNGPPFLLSGPEDTASLKESGRGLLIYRKYCSSVSLDLTPKTLKLKIPVYIQISNTQSAQPMTSSILQKIEEPGLLILVPQADIQAGNTQEFRSTAKEFIENPPAKVVVDLQKVEMLDSSGIGFLIALYNSMKKKEVAFEVVAASPDIEDLLKSMCLDQHFAINPA